MSSGAIVPTLYSFLASCSLNCMNLLRVAVLLHANKISVNHIFSYHFGPNPSMFGDFICHNSQMLIVHFINKNAVIYYNIKYCSTTTIFNILCVNTPLLYQYYCTKALSHWRFELLESYHTGGLRAIRKRCNSSAGTPQARSAVTNRQTARKPPV